MADRYEHEWSEETGGWYCALCMAIADYDEDDGPDDEDSGECPVRLRDALDAATRERDEALAKPRAIIDEHLDRVVAGAKAAEREAVVRWLRSSANAPHPVEIGERALSPSGRGLGLLWADAIERGEHTKEGT